MIKIENVVNTIIQGDALDVLRKMPSQSVDMVITSPPYWGLRCYNTEPQIWDENINCNHKWIKEKNGSEFCNKCGAWKGELGAEPTYEIYINHLMQIFNEVYRVLKDDGTCWVNLGDSYAGSNQGAGVNAPSGKQATNRGTNYMNSKTHKSLLKNCGIKAKSLIGIPDRFKIAMIDNGWICRNDIIWHKPNAMPESVKDRFTDDYERLFFFTKNRKYYFEQQLEEYRSKPRKPENKNQQNCNKGYITDRFSPGYRDYYSQGGRNKRSVWSINTKPFKGAHFAVFPEELIETPIKAGCPEGGIVMDIFMGSGTTGVVAKRLGRKYIGIELNPEYIEIANQRIAEA